MTPKIKAGFTLIEALIAIAILTIGFSALFYWFLAYGTISAKDRVRSEAQMILANEMELLVAFPALAVDSTWTVKQGLDQFELERQVLDTNDLRNIADSLGMPTDQAMRFLQRPREVVLKIYHVSKQGAPYTSSQFLSVGGVIHVSP